MSYSIPSSTKILTLTTASFLFILVDALSVGQFAMVPVVYMLLCLAVRRVYLFFIGAQIYIGAQISKRFKPFSVIILLWHCHCGIGKKQTRNLTVFMALVIWPSSTLKFLFVFDFN